MYKLRFNLPIMTDINNLKKELDLKIHALFKDNKAYLDYLLQTKQNFLYRYLETSSDKNIKIESPDEKTLLARSFEGNMGEAFKITDPDIKEGIKHLAKSVPREEKPKVQYSIKTTLDDLRGDQGTITIEAKVNWGFPDFSDRPGMYKNKKTVFTYNDPNIFRKELALRFEEVCELFN